MRLTKGSSKGILFVVLVGILLAGYSLESTPAAAPTPTAPKLVPAVSVYTHTLGGTFHTAAMAIAKVVGDHTPIKVLVKPTGGPVAWMPLLNEGKADIGIINNLDMAWAFLGTKGTGFDRNPHLRCLIPGGPTKGSLDLVVRCDSNIHTYQDLKGKRVASEYPAAAVVVRKIGVQFACNDMSWNDVVKVPVPDYKAGLKALREGRVDAAFGGSMFGAPTRELDAAVCVRALPIVDTSIPKNAKIYNEYLPGYQSVWTKKGGWLKKDQLTLESRLFNLVAYDGLDENTVYAIVEALFTHYKELPKGSKRLSTWVPEALFDPETTVPYHAGTVKFYKDRGLWTPELDKLQNELLAKAK